MRTRARCGHCDCEIDHCAFCERDDCERSICFGCLQLDLKQAIGQPHEHGG